MANSVKMKQQELFATDERDAQINSYFSYWLIGIALIRDVSGYRCTYMFTKGCLWVLVSRLVSYNMDL